jgi:hypothetical protein
LSMGRGRDDEGREEGDCLVIGEGAPAGGGGSVFAIQALRCEKGAQILRSQRRVLR